MDEEKTIDEAVEEQADEMKEFEPVAFDEVIKETEPERKDAPVLRDGGDPEPADMNMVHKHLDNFLAMLCGETPIDDNVRTSTEYWLKRLANGLGGSTKKIYYHPITMWKSTSYPKYNLSFIIIDNNPEAYTMSTFLAKIADFERVAPVSGGYKYSSTSPAVNVAYCYESSGKHIIYGQDLSTGEPSNITQTLEDNLGTPQGFFDGVNVLN